MKKIKCILVASFLLFSILNITGCSESEKNEFYATYGGSKAFERKLQNPGSVKFYTGGVNSTTYSAQLDNLDYARGKMNAIGSTVNITLSRSSQDSNSPFQFTVGSGLSSFTRTSGTGTAIAGGTIHFGNIVYSSPYVASDRINNALHEVGHVAGLKHFTKYFEVINELNLTGNDKYFTVMTEGLITEYAFTNYTEFDRQCINDYYPSSSTSSSQFSIEVGEDFIENPIDVGEDFIENPIEVGEDFIENPIEVGEEFNENLIEINL